MKRLKILELLLRLGYLVVVAIFMRDVNATTKQKLLLWAAIVFAIMYEYVALYNDGALNY